MASEKPGKVSFKRKRGVVVKGTCMWASPETWTLLCVPPAVSPAQTQCRLLLRTREGTQVDARMLLIKPHGLPASPCCFSFHFFQPHPRFGGGRGGLTNSEHQENIHALTSSQEPEQHSEEYSCLDQGCVNAPGNTQFPSPS